jgi:hypothetical protein
MRYMAPHISTRDSGTPIASEVFSAMGEKPFYPREITPLRPI